MRPLSDYVRGPAQLTRRLATIGVVDAGAGERLHGSLKPGGRLVSRDGDLWRWDGFVSRADAKTAAAIRLEQRNRLVELERDVAAAQTAAEEARNGHEQAASTLKTRQSNEREARTLFSDARRSLDTARASLSGLEREHERATTRITAIDENLSRFAEDEVETKSALENLQTEQTNLPDADIIAQAVSEAREGVSSARAVAGEARNAHGDLAREAKTRAERLQELARETTLWQNRGETAQTRINELAERLKETETAHNEAASAPDAINEKRKVLLDQIANAETRRNEAADTLARGQQTAQEADKTAKAADHEASEAREQRARLEAQAEAAAERVEEATSIAHENCEAAPEELLAISEHKEGKELPIREDVERKLERYKRERENLGGVNLRADEELKEVGERLEELAVEREDCEGAIRKLRAAIGGLNREARQRLLDAFETVNTNFSDLFKRLFNGGQAELRLIDSDDPLDAGLEIFCVSSG